MNLKNYFGYIYVTIDQKENKKYIGYSTKKIENSKKSGFYWVFEYMWQFKWIYQ